jgi:NTE family protein
MTHGCDHSSGRRDQPAILERDQADVARTATQPHHSRMDEPAPATSARPCLVMSGGVALGAYQGGAYAALHGTPELWPTHIAGASVGAVNGALIAGNAPGARLQVLERFWRESASDRWWPAARWWGGLPEPHGRVYRWSQALRTRLLGCPGVMRPRTLDALLGGAPGVYDLSPLRARLQAMVDFDRLNAGDIRFTLLTTDIETGEGVSFDTGREDRIGPDHLIASCSFPPEFPPVEIDGRLLADGGLAANAPIDLVFQHDGDESDDSDPGGRLLCFVVDLFPSVGQRPASLDQAAVRCLDLLLGNQTTRALNALERERKVRHTAGIADHSPSVVTICYRGASQEPGAQKLFDFSSAALAERWQAGHADMSRAISATRPRSLIGSVRYELERSA